MLRLVLLIVAVLLLVWLIRSARRPDKPAPREPAETRDPASDTMVACAHCGVHLPRGEAVESHGELFCGDAHRLEHEQRR